MAQGKLSQQLTAQEPQRITRTEKKQAQFKRRGEQRKFQALKQQAQDIQKKEFSNISTIEEYREKYSQLRSDLKQFFQTPEQIEESRTQRIETTRSQVTEKLSFVDQKIAETKEKYAEKEKRYRDWWGKKPSKYRNDPDHRERKREKLNDIEDDLEEELAKWKGYKKGLQEGSRELNKGKDLSYKDIENYADDVADYEERKEEARNEQREFEKKQAKKIEELQEKGYKPQVIEQSFKGSPVSTRLSFYNPKTKDWQQIAEFKEKGKVDVSKLKQYGYSEPQERKVMVSGKEFKFKSSVPIFKEEATGEFVTPYGRTGITEQQLIRQTQDQTFQKWQQQRKELGTVVIPYKMIPTSDLPAGYGGQQTASTQPQPVIMSEEVYFKQRDKKIFDFGLGTIWGEVKRGAGWVDERVHFDFKISGTPTMPQLEVISFGKKEKPTLPEQVIETGIEKLEKTSQKIENLALGEENIKQTEAGLQQKYSEQYQSSFEQKYMKDIIYGKTDFEKASKEFKESKEAQSIQKRYEEEYQEKYHKLQVDVDYLGRAKYGIAQTGINLAKLGLASVKTPTRVAGTTALVLTGAKALSVLPSVAGTGLSAGLFVYGTYKFLDPSATYIEAGGGLVTAAISGASLGYSAYKYLRTPVVKTKAIKPKLKSRTGKIVGFEQPKVVVKDVYGKETIYEVTKYPKSISRQVIPGRRTIVTSKGRVLANKLWKALGVPDKYTTLESNAIYRGIPTKQLPKQFIAQGLRGSFQFSFGKSGYQKAMERLVEYGYTPSKAKDILRYVAPKVIETEISGINILTYGDKIKPYAISETTVITRQPKWETGGVTTRGSKTIKDVYQSEKTIIGEKGGYAIIKENTNKITGFLSEKGGWYNKLTQAGKTRTLYERGILAKASGIRKGYLSLGADEKNMFVSAREYDYQTLKEYFAQRRVVPKSYAEQYGGGKMKLIKNKDVIYFDEREATGIYAEKIPMPKIQKITPIEKMSSNELRELIKDVKNIYKGKAPKPLPSPVYQPPKPVDINKVIRKLDKVSPPKEESLYYGTGQYEKTSAMTSPMKMFNLQQNLKTIALPNQKALTGLAQVKQFDLIKLAKLDIADLVAGKTALGFKTKMKDKMKLKELVKVDVGLKDALKVDVKLKDLMKQETQTKQLTQLKTILKQTLRTELISPPTAAPPTPSQTRSLPKPVLPSIEQIKKFMKMKAEKKKQSETEYYLPDFTSRALGLKPIKITSLAQANKILKKVQTGLEIRRGVNVKIPD